jgi:S1-C subfamily serine protease
LNDLVRRVSNLSRSGRFVGDSVIVTSSRPVFVIDGVVQPDSGNRVVAQSEGRVAAGDVIEAVDGHPITTQAGADAFAYPAGGPHSLTVRRGRDRQVINVVVPASCGTGSSSGFGAAASAGSATGTGAAGTSGRTIRIRGMTQQWGRYVYNADSGKMIFDTTRRDAVHRGVGSGTGIGTGGAGSSGRSSGGAGTGFGRGVPVIGGDPIDVVNGVTSTAATGSPSVGKFGFAVECRPSCTLKRTPSGEYYYKYDGFPRIVEVRERSAADRAGLRVGDLVTKVEGKSILDEDVLHGSEQRNQLRITVRRDGRDIDASMLVVP